MDQTPTTSGAPLPAAASTAHEEQPPREAATISIRLNRQNLVLVVVLLLFTISLLETFQLQRLHRTLASWQQLPAASAAPAPPGSAPTGGSLPAQVGGC